RYCCCISRSACWITRKSVWLPCGPTMSFPSQPRSSRIVLTLVRLMESFSSLFSSGVLVLRNLDHISFRFHPTAAYTVGLRGKSCRVWQSMIYPVLLLHRQVCQ